MSRAITSRAGLISTPSSDCVYHVTCTVCTSEIEHTSEIAGRVILALPWPLFLVRANSTYSRRTYHEKICYMQIEKYMQLDAVLSLTTVL
jgi:biotin synthase-related radical SAM superfamily protein